MAKKIYEWTCPECKKEIISLNKRQFEFNKGQHIQKHKMEIKKAKKKNHTPFIQEKNQKIEGEDK